MKGTDNNSKISNSGDDDGKDEDLSNFFGDDDDEEMNESIENNEDDGDDEDEEATDARVQQNGILMECLRTNNHVKFEEHLQAHCITNVDFLLKWLINASRCGHLECVKVIYQLIDKIMPDIDVYYQVAKHRMSLVLDNAAKLGFEDIVEYYFKLDKYCVVGKQTIAWAIKTHVKNALAQLVLKHAATITLSMACEWNEYQTQWTVLSPFFEIPLTLDAFLLQGVIFSANADQTAAALLFEHLPKKDAMLKCLLFNLAVSTNKEYMVSYLWPLIKYLPMEQLRLPLRNATKKRNNLLVIFSSSLAPRGFLPRKAKKIDAQQSYSAASVTKERNIELMKACVDFALEDNRTGSLQWLYEEMFEIVKNDKEWEIHIFNKAVAAAVVHGTSLLSWLFRKHKTFVNDKQSMLNRCLKDIVETRVCEDVGKETQSCNDHSDPYYEDRQKEKNEKANNNDIDIPQANLRSQLQVIHLLIDNGAQCDDYMLAKSAYARNAVVLQCLVKKYNNNNNNNNQVTVFNNSAATYRNHVGNSLLHLALLGSSSTACKFEKVKLLLECGASVYAKNKRDISPLALAFEILKTIPAFSAIADLIGNVSTLEKQMIFQDFNKSNKMVTFNVVGKKNGDSFAIIENIAELYHRLVVSRWPYNARYKVYYNESLRNIIIEIAKPYVISPCISTSPTCTSVFPVVFPMLVDDDNDHVKLIDPITREDIDRNSKTNVQLCSSSIKKEFVDECGARKKVKYSTEEKLESKATEGSDIQASQYFEAKSLYHYWLTQTERNGDNRYASNPCTNQTVDCMTVNHVKMLLGYE